MIRGIPTLIEYFLLNVFSHSLSKIELKLVYLYISFFSISFVVKIKDILFPEMIYFSLILNSLCSKFNLSILLNKILYVLFMDILLFVGLHLLLKSINSHVSMHSFVDLTST